MRIVKVPMAVDAKVKIPVGPINLPIRAVLMLIIAMPGAYFSLTSLDGTIRFVVPILLLSTAAMIAFPEKEGVWIATFGLFRLINGLLPRVIRGGRVARSRVRQIGDGMRVGRLRYPIPLPPPFNRWSKLPRITHADHGLLCREPGGWCAVLTLVGPESAPHTDHYANWCQKVVEWLLAIECPSQVMARTVRYDRVEVEATYEAHCAVLNTRLGQFERRLSGDVADRTMVVEHHVVLLPGMAAKDGVPLANDLMRLGQALDVGRSEAERALQSALRLASTFGVEVEAAEPGAIAVLAQDTVLGTREAVNCQGLTFMSGRYHGYLGLIALPPKLMTGSVITAMMRARCQALISMHLMPVDVATARSELDKQRQAFSYASKHSNDVDVRMMTADTESLIAALAGRQVQAIRIGLMMSVSGATPEECRDALDRLHAALAGEGLRSVRITTPGMVAAASTTPGGTPLRRTLIMTTDGVAHCLLPAMGTPFGDTAQPLLGVNSATGAPVYLDVFQRANHNAVIVVTSGA
ncbi:MAG: hypothetical protein ACREP9_03370 [Candidatus Dormibacteraceae bacterium]